MSTYFAMDGSYGDADGLLVLDTSSFTAEQWDEIDTATDSTRAGIAKRYAKENANE